MALNVRPWGATVVLLGFAESLAAIEAAWDLLNHGIAVHAFTRAGTTPPLLKDGRVTCHWVSSPERNAQGAVDDILALVESLGGPVLFPIDDVSLWISNAAKSRNPGVVVAAPTGELANLSLDKRQQLSIASRAGLSVPPSLFYSPGIDGSNAASTRPDFSPPWIVKPALAVSLKDGKLVRGEAKYVTNEADLATLLGYVNDAVIIQPMLRGVGEGVFGQAKFGAVSNWSSHRRIRMMNPSGSGSSACRSIDPDRELVQSCGRFIEAAKWTGLFMLEFLRDEQDVSWFMELNGRAWGSLALASRRGFAYPTWTVMSALDPGYVVPRIVPGPHLSVRHIGREIMHLGFVARGRHRLHRQIRQGSAIDPSLAAYPRLGTAMRNVLWWGWRERAYNGRRGKGLVLLADTWQTFSRARQRRKEAR